MAANLHIFGVRHHSPACARLVAARLRELQPAMVLIEGPSDFNSRLAELALPHQLPLAIFSYRSHHGAAAGEQTSYSSWTPFAEYSPEWQALQIGRELAAEVRFIDLPAWHDAMRDRPNRYADAELSATEQIGDAYLDQLQQRLQVDNQDALWDQLFEDESLDEAGLSRLQQNLQQHFLHLRGDSPGDLANQQREHCMANWLAWALAQTSAAVVVICGGYHAPALARLWPEFSAHYQHGSAPPAFAEPVHIHNQHEQARHGSFLVPYSFKRLDAFTGYASGMPSPAYYQWLWQGGHEYAGQQFQQRIVERLRHKKLSISTADLIALQLRAQALSQLRGHRHILRNDWLDALAGALLKDAWDVPLPWSYRGPLRAATDPLLVESMDVLAGTLSGKLAAGTPQPPLLEDFWTSLQQAGIPDFSQAQELKLDLFQPAQRWQSQLLHRAVLLDLPGIQRTQGPSLALSTERNEVWQLSQPYAQLAALIEAGAWGATLADAARAKLEARLRQAQGDLNALVNGLNLAALAGLHQFSDTTLQEIAHAIQQAQQFEELGKALGSLHVLWRHGDTLGFNAAPILKTVLEQGCDRALWLFEMPGQLSLALYSMHLCACQALQQLCLDQIQQLSAVPGSIVRPTLELDLDRVLAVFQRKTQQSQTNPLSRGAALGALLSLQQHLPAAANPATNLPLADNTAYTQACLHALTQASASELGDMVQGLLALARQELTQDAGFIQAIDQALQNLDQHEFVQALPALRAAFNWLPSRERAEFAAHILKQHQASQFSGSVLTQAISHQVAIDVAQHRLAEQTALQHIQSWGLCLPRTTTEQAL